MSTLADSTPSFSPPFSFQTHCDIISDFDQDLVDRLVALSKSLDFQIFEDRKFADIG